MTVQNSRRSPEAIYSCELDQVWIWEHGHLSARKMRGKALSRRPYLDADVDVEQIVHGTVRHGWVITIDGEGDAWSCGSDYVIYFETAKPNVIDGKWIGHESITYDDDDNEVVVDVSTVVDGPHEATWLEIA